LESLKHGYFIGIDLGGTKLAVGRILPNGVLDSFEKVPTEGRRGPEHVTGQILQLTRRLISDSKDLLGIGIGVPGSVDWKTGVITRLTNLAGWKNFPLKKVIEEYFQVPVFIENDANAAAWGEFYCGSGQCCRSIVYLTVSTGIGAGIIVDGKLVRGQTGNAGEVGHMILKADGPLCRCGNHGCWEALSSGTAIASRAEELVAKGQKSLLANVAELQKLKAEHVFAAYRQGDEIAKLVLDEALDYLGIGVANLVNIINPDLVVLGGGVAKAGSMVFNAVRTKVQKLGYAQSKLTEIVPAKLGDQAGVIGAALLVKEYF